MENWNLSNIYENFDQWSKDLVALKEGISVLASFKGKIKNKESLKEYLEDYEKYTKLLFKVYGYASMNYDLNQKDQGLTKNIGLIIQEYNNFISANSFFESELIGCGLEKLKEWEDEEPFLKQYDYMFTKVIHEKKHIFTPKVEWLISNYNSPLGDFNSLYDSLAVADSTFRKVKISNGTDLLVTEGNFRGYLANLSEQEDRRKVFEAVFKYYGDHKNTFAGIYKGIVDSNFATMKVRKYKSILDSYLFSNNISPKVYKTLIATTKNNTEPIKKYYQLRKKYFNLKSIHTYDRFLQFAETDLKFSYEDSKRMVLDSFKEVGGEFYEFGKKVLEEGRVDVYEKEGKRTGAYSTSIYGYGPYILLNHNDTIDSAFTIAHEAGHSIHTMFSSKYQPYATSDYVIFVAEIASTFNEQLFLDYLLKNTDDKNLKTVLLQQSIDGLLGTFYRQSLFADYEYEAHKLVEDGSTITAEALSNIMIKLYKKYYDIDLNKEEYKQYVWAYIPHFFHSPFYVYQYATSFASSMAIYEKVKNKEPGAYESYLKLLKSGGSDYPIELVKQAGVDLTTKEPFLAVVRRLNELVEELEELLK